MLNPNDTPDIEPLEFLDNPYDKFVNFPACDRVGLNRETEAYKQCIFCNYLPINDN